MARHGEQVVATISAIPESDGRLTQVVMLLVEANQSGFTCTS